MGSECGCRNVVDAASGLKSGVTTQIKLAFGRWSLAYEEQAASTSRTKILYLANSRVPSRAANAVNVLCMSAAMKRLGFDVNVAAPVSGPFDKGRRRDSGLESGCDGIDVSVSRLWYPGMRGGMVLYRAGLSHLLRTRRPDFVYGRMLAGCRDAARRGIPTVFEAHMPVWEQDSAKRTLFSDMLAQPAFRGLVAISGALRDYAVEAFPGVSGRVVVAHDAASSRPCPGFPVDWPSDPVRVLYSGSLYSGKGIELVARLAPLCPWIRFHILGGSPDEIGSWKSRMGNGVSNVEFLGYRPHSQVAEFMERADILIAPYQSAVSARGERRDIARWMSPLKIFEYMAANRPMVASDLPVLREVLAHDRNAILAAPGDVQAWVDALETLRRDGRRARRIAAAAREDFERHYTWKARAECVVGALGCTRGVSAPAVCRG